nr:shikimate kinase [Actinomycetales bacterium]
MRPLALVGPPGSGKTAVGRLVAERRGLTFVDLDEAVAERHGHLGDLLLEGGSAAVAERALSTLREVLAEGTVVAVSSAVAGGEAARSALHGADVVYLASDLAHTFRRSGLNAPQPVSLFGSRAVWKALLDERDPGYRSLAGTVVAVGSLGLEEVADAVEEAVPR